MSKSLNKYLMTIGMTNALIKRVKEIIAFYEGHVTDKVEAVFVSEYIDEEDKRIYQNLWLFTEGLAMEAKNFIGEDIFDCALLTQNVTYWEIDKTEYDFESCNSKSRMRLRCEFGVIKGEMKASKENCDALRGVLKNYILPNLTTNSG